MSAGAAPDFRLHSVHVFVRDLERSVEFYREKLGFALAFDARLQSGGRWVGIAPPNGTAVVTLIQPEPESPNHELIGRATRIVFLTEDVLGKFREWTKKGVKFRHAPRLRRVDYDVRDGDGGPAPVWGQVFTRFEDPDRNSFSLVSFDQVTASIEAQRREVEEKREADRRAAYEIEIAREVQSRLFPQQYPPCASLRVAGVCAQARQVGGDYYDFLALGQERIGLVVGDIAGKGIAAALLMANLQAHLRSQFALALDEPEKLLRSVNQLFYDNTTASAYATLFYGEYDGMLGRLRYVNCGHLAGLILRADGSLGRLGPTNTVLGLFREWDCTVKQCAVGDGDLLALYTDGVTEAMNADEAEYGEERLLESLWRHRSLNPEEMAQALLEDVRRFATREQSDDITLVAAKCAR